MNLQIALPLLVMLLAGPTASTAAVADPAWMSMESSVLSQPKAAAFHDAMDKLWEDHIIWTRQFIVSAAAGLADKDPATDRLLQNQVDIGNAIKPYYGEAAGNQLAGLLKEHIVIAAELVMAAKNGQTAKVEDAKKRWNTNADQIADFLSGANPKNWPAADTRQMMREHLGATTDEVVARLGGDWAGDIAAFEKVHAQILHMADMLADGIVKQFPKKFS